MDSTSKKLLSQIPKRSLPNPQQEVSRDPTTFGGRLTLALEATNLTLFQFSGLLDMHTQSIVKLMRGEREPNYQTLRRLIRVLEIADDAERVRWLVMGDKP